MDGYVSMEILNYDKENEILSVKYNTKVVWEYSKVDKEMYKKIKGAKDSAVELMLRKLLIVGENKEVK